MVTGQQVARQDHQLEAEEEQQQVGRADDEHRAGHREDQHGRELGDRQAARQEVVGREQTVIATIVMNRTSRNVVRASTCTSRRRLAAMLPDRDRDEAVIGRVRRGRSRSRPSGARATPGRRSAGGRRQDGGDAAARS